MADDLTIILRASREAPADALYGSAGHAFAALVRRLERLCRAEAALHATSLADPAYDVQLTLSESVRGEVEVQLDHLLMQPLVADPVSQLLRSAAVVMHEWHYSPVAPDVETDLSALAHEVAMRLPDCTATEAKQVQLLIGQALALFCAAAGLKLAGVFPDVKATAPHIMASGIAGSATMAV